MNGVSVDGTELLVRQREAWILSILKSEKV